jgi:nitrate/TMAO reductase-like tetraheme cytochrome c subunit
VIRRLWIRRILWAVGPGAGLGIGGFAAGALITDLLEQDNRFCISCHAPRDASQDQEVRGGRIARLHQEKFDRFSSRGGRIISLAGSHNAKSRVKCIDCHIGAGPRDYLIIKAIAARDAAKYLVGRYREPDTLTFVLDDRTCLKCHSDAGQNLQDPKAFHNVPYHRDPRNACSDCHRSHDESGADTRFLQQEIVKPRCDSCHLEILGIKTR